jgi:hypothetical protein
MIVYELKCSKGHGFEGWFRDAAAFDRQAAAGKVSCAVCGDSKVAKAPMAPRLAKRRGDSPDAPRASAAGPGAQAAEPSAEAVKLLAELRKKIESECDYVGERFAEEARRIHYGETEQRGIYGEASDEQAKALDEEGIEVRKIPWPPRRDT